jgi:hypothetical protein
MPPTPDPGLQTQDAYSPDPYARLLVILGIVAGLLSGGMAVIAFSTGVTQEFFEAIHPAGMYFEELRKQASLLRVVFSLDGLFLLAYSAFFVCFAIERRDKADPMLCRVLVGTVLFAALLDAVENFHILAMLHAAEAGFVPSAAEIELQYILSAIKFTAGYFAAVIFGIMYPRNTPLSRIVGTSTAIVFPLLGVLAFTTPPPWSDLCSLGRFSFFALGFLLSAIVYWERLADPVPSVGRKGDA